MRECVHILKFTGVSPTLEGGLLLPPRHYSVVAFGGVGGGLIIHSVDGNQKGNMVLITDEIKMNVYLCARINGKKNLYP